MNDSPITASRRAADAFDIRGIPLRSGKSTHCHTTARRSRSPSAFLKRYHPVTALNLDAGGEGSCGLSAKRLRSGRIFYFLVLKPYLPARRRGSCEGIRDVCP